MIQKKQDFYSQEISSLYFKIKNNYKETDTTIGAVLFEKLQELDKKICELKNENYKLKFPDFSTRKQIVLDFIELSQENYNFMSDHNF